MKFSSISFLLIFSLIKFSYSNSCSKNGSVFIQEDEPDNPAVDNLRTYLKIVTAHPNPEPGYKEAIEWLEGQADEIGLKFSVVNLGEKYDGNKVVILTWIGRDPSLKSIIFDSHMDVVAAEPVRDLHTFMGHYAISGFNCEWFNDLQEKWKYPPYEACKDENGNIFGRGVQDMKAYTVGVLEAIRILKERGFKPLRTIHMTVLPDEEKGGLKGMKPFVESEHFRRLNVGIGIDECGGNWWNDTMRICHAEKASWQFNITTRGQPGHGATFPRYTAGHRLQIILDKFFEFRRQQFDYWVNSDVWLDQITTVNLVGLGGGTATNIIAGELWAAFDMRIRQHENWRFADVEKFINGILDEARSTSDDRDDVSIEYLLKTLETGETVADDSNVWWRVIQDSCDELDIYCPRSVLNGFTDARYIRNLGIPVFGLAPFLNTPGTAHKHNEFLNEHEFLRGIERYTVLIRHLSTTPSSLSDVA